MTHSYKQSPILTAHGFIKIACHQLLENKINVKTQNMPCHHFNVVLQQVYKATPVLRFSIHYTNISHSNTMATNNYKNVILLGATGNLGKHVLQVLLTDSTFNVTVLSRNDSTASFSPKVKVLKVDYSDAAALTKALANQDVVISTVGGQGVAGDFGEVLIQAAIDAKVKWFIPSEFGVDIENPSVNIPFLAGKIAVVNLLKKNQSRIAHTFITTGGFLDWGFDNGFLGFDIKNHSAVIYDEGKALVHQVHHSSINCHR